MTYKEVKNQRETKKIIDLQREKLTIGEAKAVHERLYDVWFYKKGNKYLACLVGRP